MKGEGGVRGAERSSVGLAGSNWGRHVPLPPSVVPEFHRRVVRLPLAMQETGL